MSLMSRIQGRLQTFTRNMPIFKTVSRNLDFNDKGKAEENVYFRKEQERLLDKLRKLFQGAKSNDKSNPSDVNKGKEQNNGNN